MADNKDDETGDDGKRNWAGLSKAKRHKLLGEVQIGLRGCHQRKAFEVFGTWYELRTLDPHEHAWVLPYVQGHDAFAVGKTVRAPTVAASLCGIGKTEDTIVPVEVLFQVPDTMPDPEKKLLLASDVVRRNWVRSEVLRWLCEPEGHEPLIQVLHDRYLSLSEARVKALEALGPLSTRTPTGESSPSSSPEKGS